MVPQMRRYSNIQNNANFNLISNFLPKSIDVASLMRSVTGASSQVFGSFSDSVRGLALSRRSVYGRGLEECTS